MKYKCPHCGVEFELDLAANAQDEILCPGCKTYIPFNMLVKKEVKDGN